MNLLGGSLPGGISIDDFLLLKCSSSSVLFYLARCCIFPRLGITCAAPPERNDGNADIHTHGLFSQISPGLPLPCHKAELRIPKSRLVYYLEIHMSLKTHQHHPQSHFSPRHKNGKLIGKLQRTDRKTQKVGTLRWFYLVWI